MKQKALILLFVIFLIFIALGLPDALVGSGWNLIRLDFGMPLGAIGVTTFVAFCMTIVSTYNAPRLLRRFSTKWVTLASVLLSATSLLLISRTTAFYQMVLLAIPLGLSAGAIDLSVNHYVSHNYNANHMNYLHSFYGLGVTFGPSIMAVTLADGSWRKGYVIVAFILLGIAAVIASSFPLWHIETEASRKEQHSDIKTTDLLKHPGVKSSMGIILSYVHVESLAGVFVASYAFLTLDISESTAALFTTSYFLALTIGRALSGLLSHRIHPRRLILLGQTLMLLGAATLALPLGSIPVSFVAVFILGLGSGPVFPNMMYLNARQFPKQYASRITSLQMAVGYLGFGLLTPLAGLLFQLTTIRAYPFYIVIIVLLLITITRAFQTRMRQTSES